MTTFTSEDRIRAQSCSGNCDQGRKPCDCQEPIPFLGWIQHSDDTVTRQIPRQGKAGDGD